VGEMEEVAVVVDGDENYQIELIGTELSPHF
jgi:hypothetical protein